MASDKAKAPMKRTVILLDHSSKFLTLSKQHIDFDGGGKKSKSKGSSSTSSPVFKSSWTCSIEAAVEYCRIVYDIFPNEYLVKVVVSDDDAHVMNSWSHEQQCVPQLLKSFAGLGSPKEDNGENCSMIYGLTSAVQCLYEPPPQNSKTHQTTSSVDTGRIICITNLKNEGHVHALVACATDILEQQNSGVGSSDSVQPIKNVDLIFIHVPLSGDSGKFTEKAPKGSSLLSITISSHKASQLVSKLSIMAQKHFHLKSTTVTGIPMKEEQHSGSSANYDVEIVHSSQVHMEQAVANVFCGDETALGKKESPGTSKDTVHLKWCTPKTTSAPELQACIGCYRITPVEVNSRPTACLISFLLQGRQVMLEQPKKSGGKLVSHILASHGGDIFIHCLATYRTPMEDPPSISEGCGGRVTDYRINDFGEFMKANRLAPCSWNKKKGKSPLDKGLARLERCTRYWPMVIGETLLCNMMQLLEPLPTLMAKETVTENDVLECKRVIYRVQAMESRNDPLPVSMTGIRGKGPKREEQYRQIWAELETYLEAASRTSKMHEKVLECLRGTSPSSSTTDSPRRETPTDELEKNNHSKLSEVSLSWQEIDRYQSMTEREKTDFNRGDTNNEHFFKRSIASAVTEQAHKRLRTDNQHGMNKQTGRGPGSSLLSMWNSKMNAIAASRHEEFAGRLQSTGNKAELYSNPMDSGSNSSGRGTPVEEWL